MKIRKRQVLFGVATVVKNFSGVLTEMPKLLATYATFAAPVLSTNYSDSKVQPESERRCRGKSTLPISTRTYVYG